MAAGRRTGKLYPLFTLWAQEVPMAYLATGIFMTLYMVGPTYFGWTDPMGKVSMALFTCFLLGAVAGYKSKG